LIDVYHIFSGQVMWASAFAAKVGVKPGDLDGSVRMAITGETVGFELSETLALLGHEKVLRRIEKAVSMITAQ
jgi:glutamyl/glutaminyl-tRNA synthetase